MMPSWGSGSSIVDALLISDARVGGWVCRRICGEGGDVGGCGCVIALSRTAMLMAIVLGNVMIGDVGRGGGVL